MKLLGERLEREVRLVLQEELPSLDMNSTLSDAVVLLWIVDAKVDEAGRIPLIESVLDAVPLAIAVCGPEADSIYSVLCESLHFRNDDNPTNEHGAWFACEGTIPKCVEDFVLVAFPDEERFDGWRAYTIISPKSLEADFINAILPHLDGCTPD